MLKCTTRVRGAGAVKCEFVGTDASASEGNAGGQLVAGSRMGRCGGDGLAPGAPWLTSVVSATGRTMFGWVGGSAGANGAGWATVSGLGCEWVCVCPSLTVPCRAGVLALMGAAGSTVVGGGEVQARSGGVAVGGLCTGTAASLEGCVCGCCAAASRAGTVVCAGCSWVRGRVLASAEGVTCPVPNLPSGKCGGAGCAESDVASVGGGFCGCGWLTASSRCSQALGGCIVGCNSVNAVRDGVRSPAVLAVDGWVTTLAVSLLLGGGILCASECVASCVCVGSTDGGGSWRLWWEARGARSGERGSLAALLMGRRDLGSCDSVGDMAAAIWCGLCASECTSAGG